MRSRERLTRYGVVLGLVCAAAATIAACSPGPASHRGARPADPGWSDTAATSATAPPPVRQERWDLAEQLRPLRPAAPRARSEHAGGDLDGEVLAGAASGYPGRGPASAAGVGATLVERLFEAGGKAPVTYFVMVKREPGYDPAGGDWEYLVVAPDGHVEERGKLSLCARCHAEAPHDHLFGGR